jgi:hypothetical protein
MDEPELKAELEELGYWRIELKKELEEGTWRLSRLYMLTNVLNRALNLYFLFIATFKCISVLEFRRTFHC